MLAHSARWSDGFEGYAEALRLVGILGDVDGRIVPVAPPPVFEFEPDIASYAVYRLIELLLPPAQNEGRGTVFDE